MSYVSNSIWLGHVLLRIAIAKHIQVCSETFEGSTAITFLYF